MELSELPGVDNVEVDVDGKEVIVNFQDPTNEKEIRNLLVEIGYSPTK
jgi:copper chaperone CopZ